MGEVTIFLDIETIPTQSAEARERIAAGVKPPASMKKADTIAKWEAEDKPAAVEAAIAKTSFDAAHGHICTIGFAFNGDPALSYHAYSLLQERQILSWFFDHISTHHHVTFVGHYISGFDLPFILRRAVVLGVPIPQCIPRDPKPWGGQVFDTMTAWAGTRDTISMNDLCAALGIEGKGEGLDGSQIAQAWLDGRHDEIAAYCEADVERTREIWRKFKAVNW
jgi:DNA polymerase elongation subunit (family B)